MKIPILNGIYSDGEPGLQSSYPVNLVPVVHISGVSEGYLRPAEGIIQTGTGTGNCRGGINWNGSLYRVMGSKLVKVASDGTVTTLGDVGDNGKQVSFDYSFDRLAVASNGNLFYWDGSALTQVTDADLGTVLDLIWVDGYFMTTDGEFLVVTEINDPYSVNPLKYGSSEIDPDPVLGLLKLRNEVRAINRYSIETFANIGGTNFPFQRVNGAQITKGAIGTQAVCIYMETMAFLGSGRNEQPAVYMAQNGMAQRISTKTIDAILENYAEAQLSLVKLESRNDRENNFLYVHLPDQTLVYDFSVSQLAGEPVWFILNSGTRYNAINFVYAYDRWNCGDPASSKVGYLTPTVGSHWGNVVTWEFGTQIFYNESRGAIFSELELVALTGRIIGPDVPSISTSYSLDGVTWSQDRSILIGALGDRFKRLVWFRQGTMQTIRAQRFRGDSAAHISFLRLEARIEPLQN